MWSLIGMEVGILSFLALSTLKCSLIYEDQETLEKRKLFFVLTLFTSITGILVRLDFSILVFVIFITQFFLSSKKRYLQLFTLTNAGFIVLTVLGILAFQFFYYGDFMPNTYRLKVDGYSIFDRVLNGVLTIRNITAILFLVFVVALIAIKEKKNVINKTIIIGSSVFPISCAYSIWVGGDAWERVGMANRFVSVTLPFAIISIFLGAYNFFKQTQLTVKCQNIYIFFVFLVTSCLLNFYPTRVITSNLIFLVALLLAVTYFCCKLYNCYIKKSGLNFQSRVILFLLIVILVSGRGWAMWIENGEIQSDYDYKNRGIYLKEITSDNAVIAVVTAGAQAYYSQRPMIDILGKSDKKIASVKPIGNFYPGHNKWDYDYSIGFLRPDVVAELWIDKDSDLVKKKLIQWGYVQKCYSNKLKGYFLEKSKAIRWSHLKNC
jgi:arabinofuranosyltransferase